ncbi:metallophosphoesterase family protein [Aquirhabdus parva]|uniref:Serine/threonine protein phosphatase n=1 Tax=Aquirhabdus parva TaxID=2283318 RepID=A0A345P4R4_9GAMM|nr:metallophosphoesterase [Aquirhabdus parva]AXI02273.1 serine/threonine protein phosphatase [Aquirhabdus parva]
MSNPFNTTQRVFRLSLRTTLFGLACGGLLYGCNGSDNDVSVTPLIINDAATADANLQAAWVTIGDNNQAIARVITNYTPASSTTDANAVCPLLTVDGHQNRMTLRVGAGNMPLRTTASDPVDSKPSSFPVSVCEANLSATAKQASVGSRTLPLPKAEPQHILVLGDTGCRLKKSGNAYQACNDPTAWPLSTVVASAASLNPDLVIHVGDYHYRENLCPSDITGCKDSPWGYGWDTWQADLFKPAAALFAKAPWVVVRGNHEECARAGQGWFRFLDPRAYSDARSCNDPSNDNVANYSDPYAVPLGADSQIIIFDSSKAGANALKTTDLQFQTYQKQFQTVAALAAKTSVKTTLFTNHHPILAFAPIAGANPAPGNLALQSVMSSLNAQAYYPAGIQLALHGHVHDFQAINFASNHPATIVAGNAGDTLDVALPDPLPTGATPAPGAVIDKITHHSTFGFMMMDRNPAPATGWTYKAYTTTGKLLTTCTQTGRQIACDKTGYITP